MHDYYDPHPVVTIDRHVVIAGYIGAESRQIGYQLAALTGLGVTDLDRKIEHHVGRSIQELIWSQGEWRYRQLERKYLGRLLAERPWSILSVGDGALIDDRVRQQVLDQALLVVLDVDLPNCFWRIKSQQDDAQVDWHPLYPGPIERFEQLRPFYEQRWPGFSEGHHHIELRGKGRKEIVERLMELIGGGERYAN
ncbi:MAG: shikimate kinase [Acidobacteriota bacterium]